MKHCFIKLNNYFSNPLLSYSLTDLNKMLGVSPSDIDKYSRVVFPVCFVSIRKDAKYSNLIAQLKQ